MDWLEDRIEWLQGIIFESAIQPVLYKFGWTAYSDIGFDWLNTFIYGCVAIAIAYAICRPLELLKPVQKWREAGPSAPTSSTRLSTAWGSFSWLFSVF
jgi:hypothetical protein